MGGRTQIEILIEELQRRLDLYKKKLAKEADDEIGIIYESKIEELESIIEFINTNQYL